MPIQDYPFITVNTDVVVPAPLIGIGGPNASPYLWLRITTPATHQAMIVAAGIDTGADALVAPADDAETLGHTLKATRPHPVKTGKGLTHAYPHTAAVDVLGVLSSGHADESMTLYSMPETVIYFTVGQKAYLIGQGSLLLSRCVLTIDYPKKRFSVRLPN